MTFLFWKPPTHYGVSSDEEKETYGNRFLAKLLFSSVMGGVGKMRVSSAF